MSIDLRDLLPENRPNGLEWPLAQILVVERHGLLYRPIAKSACSSLKRMMVGLSGLEHADAMLAAPNIHDAIDNHRSGIKLLDLDRALADAMLVSDHLFKFAVVRDPFERLVSAYVEKFVINRKTSGNRRHTAPVVAAVQQRDDPDLDRGITFAEFVGHVTTQDPAALDVHWTPQHRYLAGVRYDRVYRMDELALLRRDVEQRVGRAVELPHRNRTQASRTRHVAGAARRLPGRLRSPGRIDKSSFLDSELLFRIATYYAEDYRLHYR